MPKLIMMIGVAGSGKTSWAREYAREHDDVVIHSSDEIRKELHAKGFEIEAKSNVCVFALMKERTIRDLNKGMTVIYDATNINVSERICFLNQIRFNVRDCFTEAVYINKPLEVCLEQNSLREGFDYVPKKAINRMYRQIREPEYSESWSKITVVTG